MASGASAADCLREWEELQEGYQRIQDNHKLYKQKLEELTKLQDGISSSIARQKKRLKELSLSLKKCKAHARPCCRPALGCSRLTAPGHLGRSQPQLPRAPPPPSPALEPLTSTRWVPTEGVALPSATRLPPSGRDASTTHASWQRPLENISCAPSPVSPCTGQGWGQGGDSQPWAGAHRTPLLSLSRLYLSLVLGNVNVTLLSKQAKFAYKDEYEKFKLYLTIILLIVSFSCRFLLNSRVTDAVFNFLLVWYYCTLTIRESILINNGSKIKGWWVFHHYVSTFLSGVMLTWPDGLMYQMFRNQFLSFSMYQSFVQFLQYYYQSGCLYRLRALGERHNMDLTVEGFQSWMWRGLTFLLPFLFFGQFWQLYNAVTLFRMLQHPECKEWQVLMCGLPFFILFLGNFFTTLRVVHQKFQNQNKDTKRD
eukprot:XP_027328270.1 transmembrane protein 120A [Anas platyrhynchos]